LKIVCFLLIIPFAACEFEYDLPEANSKEDETPPSANFSATVSSTDYLTINFANLSSSATDYIWDFGDGNTSTDKDGKNTYDNLGTYTVSLTAVDKLGESSEYSMDVEVVEPAAVIPEISEASFEDGTDTKGCGDENADGRDCWRNSDLGGVIQITGSPVYDGSQAAKFPSDGSRIAYQELTVSPNFDYVLTYYYTMKTSGTGAMNVAVLAGSVSNSDDVAGATIESFSGTDQTSASDYVKATIYFNTGDNSTVSIYMSNVGVECRVDKVSIDLKD